MKSLPKSLYAHTMEHIDFSALKDKKVGVIGVGASAFDAAGVALETGAKRVDILMRRDRLPAINKFAGVPAQGFNNGFFKLDDIMRWKFMCVGFNAGTPPTMDSLQRISQFSNFRLISNAAISDVNYDGSQIQVVMPSETYTYDFIILGTGYQVNGYQREELSRIISDIALWKDLMPIETVKQYPKMGEFPYLGPSYEFVSKDPHRAPHLKNLYCFNYAAILSHGLLSTHILGISIGATRLAQGIAADFFIQDCNWYLEQMENFQESEFDALPFNEQ